jgi:hypothetical protein
VNDREHILIGNSFPMSLVRRAISVETVPLAALRAALHSGAVVHSYWGHENTRHAAELVLDADLCPHTERPVVSLDAAGLPNLDGCSFRACYVLSPDYATSFRPAIGQEVAAEKICGWKVLKLEWK